MITINKICDNFSIQIKPPYFDKIIDAGYNIIVSNKIPSQSLSLSLTYKEDSKDLNKLKNYSFFKI